MDILLASKSPTRAKLLENAGIRFQATGHGVDEEEVKLSMSSFKPKEVAVKLSELKALKVSSSNPNTLVIGSDQVLDLGGELFSKVLNREAAVEQLKTLNGKEHTLITSTVIAKNNNIESITGTFIPTEKNKMVEKLYLDIGFELISKSEKENTYVLKIKKDMSDLDHFIKVID